jgi:beta-glucosidase
MYKDPLKGAIRSGLIAEELVDRSVCRLLDLKFELGLFDNPYIEPSKTQMVFDVPAQSALALEIAQKSMILLKNEGSILPLRKDLNSLAVIGPNAHNPRHMVGDYAYQCHIENLWEMKLENNVFDTPVPDHLDVEDISRPTRTVFEALHEKVAEGSNVYYAKGCDVTGEDTSGFSEAVELALSAEVAVVVVGGKSGLTDSCTCGEARDRATLSLTGVQEELVKQIYATGTPTIVVLVNGRPLALNWIVENIPGIIEAWLPGEEGAAAIADVLFGDVNPGGKLPITIPRGVGQIPIHYRHKPSGGRSHWKGEYVDMSNKPLYPFGHGLSYTTFKLANLKVDRSVITNGEKLAVSVEVINVGKRPGDEVLQIYTRDVEASLTRPGKELKGFKRVHLKPGEAKTVAFTLFANQFGFYNEEMDFILEPGKIKLMIGVSSENLPLETEIEITGKITDIGNQKSFFSEITII